MDVPHLNRLIYVDDSGHPQSGLVTYGWIEFSPDRWADVLARWLDTRKRLWREFGVPVTQELHTTAYVNGRGRISKQIPDRHRHEGVEYWKDFGREVAGECLETLRCSEGLTVGSVYRQGKPEHFATTKQQLYASLIERFENELANSDSLALVFMDGDGTDTSYRSTHRGLPLKVRRVVEDAIHLDSRSSQLVQMADLVAWSAYVSVERHPPAEFAWDWYTDHLAERDPQRKPIEISQ